MNQDDKDNQEKLSADVAAVKVDVADVKADVAHVKTDVMQVKDDVADVQVDTTKILTLLKGDDFGQQGLVDSVTELKKKTRSNEIRDAKLIGGATVISVLIGRLIDYFKH
jgi:hypothetical protein